VIRRHLQGESDHKIAAALGRAQSTVSRLRKAPDIAAMIADDRAKINAVENEQANAVKRERAAVPLRRRSRMSTKPITPEIKQRVTGSGYRAGVWRRRKGPQHRFAAVCPSGEPPSPASAHERRKHPLDTRVASHARIVGGCEQTEASRRPNARRLVVVPAVVLPAICDTRGLRRLRAPAPCPRSRLVSEDLGLAVRRCARAVRRTTERLARTP
jgi:hypothetical protein